VYVLSDEFNVQVLFTSNVHVRSQHARQMRPGPGVCRTFSRFLCMHKTAALVSHGLCVQAAAVPCLVCTESCNSTSSTVRLSNSRVSQVHTLCLHFLCYAFANQAFLSVHSGAPWLRECAATLLRAAETRVHWLRECAATLLRAAETRVHWLRECAAALQRAAEMSVP
jgi:hypothetical protein